MKRRTLLAAGATAVGVPAAGCTAWLANRENDTENGGDEKGANNDSKTDDSPMGDSTDGDGEGNETANADGENDEYPEAADPEADPEVDSGPDDIANESEVEADDPTAEDITIANDSLRTASDGAVVSGTVTNDSETPLTVDLEVTFLNDGQQIGRPALGGTTGLQPGDSWNFEIAAAGEKYSKATDYEIAPMVRV